MAFEDMAAKREEEAAQLNETDIWVSVLSKFVLLDMPIQARIEMIKQAVGGDIELIKSTLRTCKEKGILTQEKIKEIVTHL